MDASLNLKPSLSQVDASLNLKPSFSQVDASLNLKPSFSQIDASLNLKPSFAQVDASLNAIINSSQIDASLNLKSNITYVDASLNLKPSFSQVDASLNLKPSFSQVDASLNLKPSFSQVDASLNLMSAVTYVDASLNLKANLASPTFTGTPNAPTALYDNSSNQIATTGFVQGRISSIINSAPAALDTLNELAAALGNNANFAATVTNSLSQKANTTDVNAALDLKATVSSVDVSLNLKPSFSQVDASLNMKPSFSQVDASLNLKPSFSQVDASLNMKPSFSQVDASLNLKSSVTYVDASLNLKPSFSQVDASLNMKPTFAQVDASLNAIVNMSQVDASLNLKPSFSQVDASLNLKPSFSQVDVSLNMKPSFSQVDASLNLKPSFSQVDASLNLKPNFSQVDASLNLKANVASPTFTGIVTAAKLTSGDASFNGNVDISGVLSVTQTVNSVVKNTTINNYNVAVTNDLSLNGKLMVSSDVSLNSKLYVKGDASFNGRVDICGNFYANYPANSIPSSAIIGGVSSGSTGSVDISSNQTISGVKTFTNGLNVGTTLVSSVGTVGAFDLSFQRIQIGQDIDGEAAGDQSGWSISINSDGTVVAIGAVLNAGNGSQSGHVRVYKNINGTWTKLGQDLDGEATTDQYGWSVSLSADGTIVAIGSQRNDGTTGTSTDNRGHVRVYKYNGSTTWTQLGQDIDGETAGNFSGTSVSLSSDGTIVAIGAARNSGTPSLSMRGHVRVYQYNGSTTWTQLGQDIDGEATNDGSGQSVSLSSDGTIVAIGATGNTSYAGHVRVYKYNGSTTWTQLGQDIDGEAASDYFGQSVSLSSDGTIIAIGASYNDGTTGTSTDNRGHVRVYKYNGSTTWTQLGQDIDGEAAEDQSGYSVSLSSDGTIIAIGAPYNSPSGHVRIYQYSGTTWTQLGGDINGEATGDKSGWSVSLSSDSKCVAIGGWGNNSISGHARVYKIRDAYVATKIAIGNNVDICGNLYAQYAAASIPASAINGISTAIQSAIDLKATKTIVDASFTSVNSAIALKATTSIVDASFTSVNSAIALKANLASPALTGVPTAPTATSGTNTTQLATTAFVTTAVSTKADLASATFTGNVVVNSLTVGRGGGNVNNNSAFGASALLSNTTGSANAAVGFNALKNNATGVYNSVVGYLALISNTTGARNSAFGSTALYNNNGDSNSAFGDRALESNTTGTKNNAFGSESLYYNTTGIENTAIGDAAGFFNKTGTYNTFLGANTDVDSSANTWTSSTAIGANAKITASNQIMMGVAATTVRVPGKLSMIGDASFNGRVDICGNFYAQYPASSIPSSAIIGGVGGGSTSGVDISSNQTISGVKTFTNGLNVGSILVSSVAATIGAFDLSFQRVKIGQDIDGEAADDQSGYSVSMNSDGTVVAISAIQNDGTTGTTTDNRGSVRVYKNISGTWTKLGQDIDGETAGSFSGTSVSLSSDGTIVAIGAYTNNGVNGTNSGHVRVYKYNGSTTWTQLGQDIDGEAANDNSGYSVSLSSDGTIVAIGATGNDGTASNAGQVRVYKNISGNWTKLGQDIDGEAAGDFSGWSVSLSSDGTIVAIGAIYNDGTPVGADRGHVRVYKYNGSTTWTQVGQDIDGEAAGDYSGYSVSLSADGTIVAIGAIINVGTGGLERGHVRVYQYNGSSTWTKLGQDIDGEAASDQSGYSVSLSSDGTILAVGALFNNGVNGTASSHVRIYQYNGTTWTQLGSDIDGEAAQDYSGSSVSLSSDSQFVAIGAILNAGVNGAYSGHVRVYKIRSITTTSTAKLIVNNNLDICGNLYAQYAAASIPASAINGISTTIQTAIDLKATKTIVDASFTSVNSAIDLKATKTIVDASFTSVNTAIALKANLANPTFTGTVTASKVTISSDASFNGRVDICGNFYAQYPASSIPSSAIIGGVGGSNGSVDISSNQTISGVKTFTNGLNVGSILVSSVTGNPSFQRVQIGQDIDGEAAGDYSGWSVSMNSDGTIVAIGAPYNAANGSSAGQVRVYKNISGTWTKLGQDIDGEAAGDQSSRSLALSADGTIVAIGALTNDGTTGLSTDNRGHVRIYKYNGSTTWTKLGQDIDGEASDDLSGWSVSLSSDGTIVAIGAIYNDGTTGTASDNRGHVRVYKYNGSTTWTQIGQDIDGEAAGDWSGQTVSLSADGTIVAIGASFNDGTSGANRGHVRVYKYNGSTTWTQIGQDIDGEAASDQSGWSVSLSADGTIVAIGALYNDGNPYAADRGHVRVYKYNGSTTWTQIGQDIDGEDADGRFGYSVSLSSDGTILAVGAYYNDGNGSDSGHVRIYQYSGTTWSQLGSDIDGEAANNQSGYSVSLSNDGAFVAIGATRNNANGVDSGHVRVYKIRDLTTTKLIVNNAIDICGNLYAQYAAASIPASAINGISTTIQSAIDLKATKTIVDASFTSVNSAIALKADLASPTFTGNVVASKMRVTSDASFNGRVDICGNFYAQYPASSIPSSAIIGGVGGGSSINLAADISVNGVTVGRGGGDSNFSTVLGLSALGRNTTGYMNVAVGCNALFSNLTGNQNVAMNFGALYSNTTGSDNIAIGKQAINANQTGSNNVGIGTNAIKDITSSNNTAVGYQSLVYSSTGSSNTAFGYLAGQNNSSGSFNTYIGYGADLPAYGATWSNSTAIGANAKITASNQIVLGTAAERVFMPGKLTTSGDASFNGRVDICGNFYAKYPAGSIPSSAITGGVLDLTSSQTITGTKTFSTQINIGTNAITQLATLAVSQLGANLVGPGSGVNSTAINAAGTIVAVSSSGYSNYRGAVRVYQWSGTAWTQLGSDILSTTDGTQMGISVSLNSTGLILAAGGLNRVRIYQYANSAWSQLGTDIINAGGNPVSISSDGTTVALGNQGAYINGGENTGRTIIFKYINSTWTQLGQDLIGEAAGDRSGCSVALSADGTIVVIGANYNYYLTGHARIYKYANSTWTQLGQDIDGENGYDMSGWSVDISDDGTVVAIGAPRNTTGATTYNGHARVYKYANSTWTKLGQDIDGRAIWSESGSTVSLSADGYTLAIGAALATGLGGETNRGYAVVFKYNGTTWSMVGSYIEGQAAGNQFGLSLALSSDGTILSVGSPNNSGTGSVQVYKIQTPSSKIIVSDGVDICGNLYAKQLQLSSSATFNGRVDICGNFYAQYPPNSIPASAIIGGVGSSSGSSGSSTGANVTFTDNFALIKEAVVVDPAATLLRQF